MNLPSSQPANRGLKSASIADTFLESKEKLPLQDRARADEALVKLRRDPSNPGLSVERLNAKRGKRPSQLWSARVNDDLRIIYWHEGALLTALYVARHDEAYRWANSRRAGFHPGTGEFQLVRVPEVSDSEFKSAGAIKGKRLLKVPARVLMEVGVPEDWIEILLSCTDQDEFLLQLDNLPEGVGERVLDLSMGRKPTLAKPPESAVEAFKTPSARQWLWAPETESELKRVLSEPFEAWRLFLHPSQSVLVSGETNGPVKITGSAGTGKSVVAMHRTAELAKKGKRVLLLTFTKNLCASLNRGVNKLLPEGSRRHVEVSTVDSLALRLLKAAGSPASNLSVSGDEGLAKLLEPHLQRLAKESDRALALLEWERVIRLQALLTWDEYRVAERSGRSQALGESRRREIWAAIEPFLAELARRRMTSYSHQRRRAWEHLRAHGIPGGFKFDAVVVDELQDLTAPAIRLVAELGKRFPENLMLIGDGGQRIYPGGFSLRSLGIDVRGRSHRLRVNYRTTSEIQAFAGKLRGAGDDLDGGKEVAEDTRAVLRGREPEIRPFETEEEHDRYLLREIGGLLYDGFELGEIVILGRHWSELMRLGKVLGARGIHSYRIDNGSGPGIALASLHGAKGLEYRAAFVVRCDEGVLPSIDENIAKHDKLLKLEEEDRELALLYVGLTRARERVVVTHVGKPSPFLELLSPPARAEASA